MNTHTWIFRIYNFQKSWHWMNLKDVGHILNDIHGKTDWCADYHRTEMLLEVSVQNCKQIILKSTTTNKQTICFDKLIAYLTTQDVSHGAAWHIQWGNFTSIDISLKNLHFLTWLVLNDVIVISWKEQVVMRSTLVHSCL